MQDPAAEIRHAVGVMTGTSLDGLDAALVRLRGRGLEMTAELGRLMAQPLGDLAGPLRAAAEQKPMTAGELARLAWDFGLRHADVIAELVSGSEDPDLIVVHGQTVYHEPPVSWQLINSEPIRRRFSGPVVDDLRQPDLAAGGQGAPITPLADWIMFRSPKGSRAVINLGGFCNLTILPPGAHAPTPEHLSRIHGFDLCPCNQLLDAIARRAFGYAYDEGGRRARSGLARNDLVAALLVAFKELRSQRRSLGTGDEATAWVDSNLHASAPADLAASACTALGRAIAAAIEQFGRDHYDIDEIILAGGGAHNAALVEAIRTHTIQKVALSSDHGVPVEAREAMAMAILGALRLDGVPVTLPQVTGRAGSNEPGHLAVAAGGTPNK